MQRKVRLHMLHVMINILKTILLMKVTTVIDRVRFKAACVFICDFIVTDIVYRTNSRYN